jgi:hypothetical protein
MRDEPKPVERAGRGKSLAVDLELNRRFQLALVLYAVLAGLVWFTMGEDKVFVLGRQVELRLLPLVVIGGLVLRTVVAHQAEKIRRSGNARSGNEGARDGDAS